MSEQGALDHRAAPVRWGRYLGAALCVIGGTAASWVVAVAIAWFLGRAGTPAQRLELLRVCRDVFYGAPLVWGVAWWGGARWWARGAVRRRLAALEREARLTGAGQASWLDAQRDVSGAAPRVVSLRAAARARLGAEAGAFKLWPLVPFSFGLAPLLFSDLHGVLYGLEDGLRVAAGVSLAWVAACLWEIAATWLSSREDRRAAARDRLLLAQLIARAGGQVLDVRDERAALQAAPDAGRDGFGLLPALVVMASFGALMLALLEPSASIALILTTPLLIALLCLRAALRALLAATRVAPAVVTQSFWSEELRGAQAARRHDMDEPAALGWRCPVWVAVAAALVFAGVCMGASVSYFQLSGHMMAGRASIGLYALCAVPLVSAVSAMFAVERGLLAQRRIRLQRAQVRADRHIAGLIKLAGGLTLAESAGDDAPLAALSPGGAQGGELEQTEEGR